MRTRINSWDTDKLTTRRVIWDGTRDVYGVREYKQGRTVLEEDPDGRILN